MNGTVYDPVMDNTYKELLKQDLKQLAPSEPSETWEALKRMYQSRRKRRVRQWLTGSAITLAAAVIVGVAVYRNVKENRRKA